MLLISQIGLGFADLFGVKTPPMVLPTLPKLRENLAPAGAFSWVDELGWHAKAITPFPGAELLASQGGFVVGAVAMSTAVMLPALSRARGQAERIRCASNLRQIGQGIMIYRADHKGQNPPDLGTLVKDAMLTANVMICSERGMVATPAGLKEDALADWVNKNTSYVLLKDVSEKDKPELILAYEKPEIHGNGMNVLFNDGHVEWMNAAQGQAMLAQQAAERAKK